jgi:hypothetical protein
MAFETGVSTSPSDLLSKLVTRLTTDGWTIIRTNGSPGAQVSISDGSATLGTQFNFVADDTTVSAHIACQPSTGDGGSGVAFYAHTGSPNVSGAFGTFVQIGQGTSITDQGFSGSHTAYFFFTGTTSEGRYCNIVVEGTAGVYWHMAFGTCEKAGTFDGGQYISGSNVGDASNDIHWLFEFTAPSLTTNTSWLRDDDHYNSIGQSTDGGLSEWFEDIAFAGQIGSAQNMFGPLYQGGLQNFNQRTPFCPIWLHVFNHLGPSAGSTAFKIVGHIPDMRFVSMDGREPGEIITIGADDWYLFPMHIKTTDGLSSTSSAYQNTYTAGGAPNNDSNLMGLAYRKVT